MRAALAIARRELTSLFVSPLAWGMLAVSQVLLAYVFLRLLQGFSDSQGQLQALPGAPGLTRLVAMPLFEVSAIVFMMMTPLITMRLVAEERRARTLSLLLCAPISSASIVLGKFLGAYAFLLSAALLTAGMPLSLRIGAALDMGLLAAGCVGLALLCALFTAVGLYLSSLTAQPAMAAAASFGLLLFLWLIDPGTQPDGLLAYLSLRNHYQALLRGVIDSRDIVYFGLVSAGCLFLSARRVEAERSPP